MSFFLLWVIVMLGAVGLWELDRKAQTVGWLVTLRWVAGLVVVPLEVLAALWGTVRVATGTAHVPGHYPLTHTAQRPPAPLALPPAAPAQPDRELGWVLREYKERWGIS